MTNKLAAQRGSSCSTLAHMPIRNHCLSAARANVPSDAPIAPTTYGRMFPELPSFEADEQFLHALGNHRYVHIHVGGMRVTRQYAYGLKFRRRKLCAAAVAQDLDFVGRNCSTRI